MSQNDPFKPFGDLDFHELIKPENWTVTSALHTPILNAALSEQAETLTFTFASGHVETLQRSDIEALTRYLQENAHVAPLVVDMSVLDDIHPRRVDE
jgi:hypothetical protein